MTRALPFRLVALALLGGLLAAGCGRTEATAPAAAPAVPVSVQVASAEARRLPGQLEVTGSLVPDAQTEIASEVAGRVLETRVERGSVVATGAVVARVDDEEARHALREAEATEAQTAARLGLTPGATFDPAATPDARKAQATAERAEAEHRRYATLVERGLVSRSDYELRRMEYLTARAEHEAEINTARQLHQTHLAQRARVALARRAVTEAVVRAPFDGLIAERHVSVGQYLTKGARVATLVRTDPLRVELAVPESAIGAVRRGQKVSFAVQAYPDRRFEGTVAWVGPSVRADSRALVVEAVVPNRDGRLQPGFFVTASVELPAVRPAVLVPAAAVHTVAGVSSVFVVRNERAERRLVQPGRQVGELVEIERGLEAGETVAVGGHERLDDGTLVAVAGPGAAGATSR